MMNTEYAKTEELQGEWYLLDARDKVLGRFASEVASALRGKHKASFSPHQECGDFIIVLNADKVRLTGDKRNAKKYYRYSTRPGHKKEISFEELNEKKPGEALRLAVRGMLPKNILGRKQLAKLKLYVGEEHPHHAQQPSPLGFDAKGRIVFPKPGPRKVVAKKTETPAAPQAAVAPKVEGAKEEAAPKDA